MTSVMEAQALEISAVVSAAQGHFDTAIFTIQNAVALEEAMPPPQGLPLAIKPAHELLGELSFGRSGRWMPEGSVPRRSTVTRTAESRGV